MSGSEKVCEYDNEYYGWDMYDYKENNIQIHPKNRKYFKNQKATLIIERKEIYTKYKGNHFFYIYWTGMLPSRPKERLIYRYHFVLEVPSIQGQVKGKYYNITYDLGTTIRKLKRLVGSKNLTIIHKEGI